MAMLEIDNLHVVYKESIKALSGITLTVDAGTIAGILGTNGAGKTTTLRAISGFIGLDSARITDGSIRFDGSDLTRRPPYRITAQGIVLVPERDKIFPNLTVRENLSVVASRLRGAQREDLEMLVYDHFPQLKKLIHREAGFLSGGERQMLALGSAIVCAPKLMLIDELSLGLAPVIVEEIIGHLQTIRKDLNLTILMVEQNAAVAFRMADYVHVFEHGEVVLGGTAEKLQADKSVRNIYLGAGGAGRRSYRDIYEKRMEKNRGNPPRSRKAS